MMKKLIVSLHKDKALMETNMNFEDLSLIAFIVGIHALGAYLLFSIYAFSIECVVRVFNEWQNKKKESNELYLKSIESKVESLIKKYCQEMKK